MNKRLEIKILDEDEKTIILKMEKNVLSFILTLLVTIGFKIIKSKKEYIKIQIRK